MSKTPTAAALIIGNEILSGRTADVNINTIATKLTEVGVRLKEVRVVPDDETEIVAAVNALRNKYNYLFTTGGIGPTHDDITIPSIAKALGVKIERRAEVVAKFKEVYKDKATDATFRMADYPAGAQLVECPVVVAPACRVENVFPLAGIPNYCKGMLEAVLPLLEKGERIHTKSVDAMAGESKVSFGLERIQNEFPTVEIGSYPFRVEGKSGTSLVVRGTDREKVEAAFTQVNHMLDEMGA